MSATNSRREFLGQGAQVVGLLAWAGCSRCTALAADDVAQRRRLDSKRPGSWSSEVIAFLRPRQDAKGGWSTQREPGVTALVVTALLRSGQVAPGEPVVTKALAYLEGFISPKGGLSEAPHANYSTSIALLAFREANTKGRYDRTIKAGQEFLKIDAMGRVAKARPATTPSTAGPAMAARTAGPTCRTPPSSSTPCARPGLPADDPNLQKAIVFVSRCQNLKSEFNDQPWSSRSTTAVSSTRPPTAGRAWPAKTPDGGLRSYASMTYAGLKSMIYAGLTATTRASRPR